MVIDTSALLAILLAEAEAEDFTRAIAGDPKRLVSALTVLEAAIVLHSRKALSRSSGEPLLFKGNDFSKTDVVAVTRSD